MCLRLVAPSRRAVRGLAERLAGSGPGWEPARLSRRKPGDLATTADLDVVDFETFQRVLNRPGGFRDPGEPEEYCRGFQVFDKDMTGFIGVGQLKYILTNLGEKMTDEEVDELLKVVDTSSGQVNYTGKRDSPPAKLEVAIFRRVLTGARLQIWSGPFLPTNWGCGMSTVAATGESTLDKWMLFDECSCINPTRTKGWDRRYLAGSSTLYEI